MGKLNTKYIIALCATFASVSFAADNKSDTSTTSNINIGQGLKIVSINHPDKYFNPLVPEEPLITRYDYNYTYPTTPLAGFTPFVAVMASDKNSSGSALHELESGYDGNSLASDPLFPVTPYVIGVLDSGSSCDFIFGSSAAALGITGSVLTDNTEAIRYLGPDEIQANITYPIGIFTAGLDAVNSDNTVIDSKIIGHSNNSIFAAGEVLCQGQEFLTATIGRSLLSFYTTVIRNDTKYEVQLGSNKWCGPDIEFLPAGSTDIPAYSYEIPVNFVNANSGFSVPLETAAYLDSNSDGKPETTTALGKDAFGFFPYPVPMDGIFYVDVDVTVGDTTETLSMMVQTGSQTTILSPTAAAALGLTTSEFTVDICGFNDTMEDIPGYYLDTVSITTTGTTLSFSHVPVISADFNDSNYDGILGMNFFYDRNITLAPVVGSTANSCTLYVSDPVDTVFADFDHNGAVDLGDFAQLAGVWLSSSSDNEYGLIYDLKYDYSIDAGDLDLFAERWLSSME